MWRTRRFMEVIILNIPHEKCIVTFFYLFMLLPGSAFAQEISSAAVHTAIGGYSPVSYFTENKAELGSSEFLVEHKGSVYFFTSNEQVKLFNENPNKYLPRYRTCPYSLALGKITPLDPTNFKIVGDSLLLFHQSEKEDGLAQWNSSEISEAELLRRADANIVLQEF